MSGEPDVATSAVQRQVQRLETFLEHVRAARLKTVRQESWVILDNTTSGAAADDALKLQAMIAGQTPPR